MKIQVTALGEAPTESPAPAVAPMMSAQAPAPRSGGGVSSLPRPLSKNNKPGNVVPSSAAMFNHFTISEYLPIGLFGFLVYII